MKKVPLHLRITEELRSQLEAAAEVAGTTPNTVAAILLSQALNHGKGNADGQHMEEATRLNVAGLVEALAEPEDLTELMEALEEQDAANVAAILAVVNEEK